MKESGDFYTYGSDRVGSDEIRWNVCRHLDLEAD
jgi:hypothetical protein